MIKSYNIKVNGNTYNVEVEEVGSASSNATAPRAEVPRAAAPTTPKPATPVAAPAPKPAAPAPAGGTSITSPMPGTINDVRVKVGDKITKGQVLIILEAMKMENEIVASCDGTVSAVNVTKGASVNVGDVLVSIS